MTNETETSRKVFIENILIFKTGFGGCISGLLVNGEEFGLADSVLDVGNVNLDGCPPYHEPDNKCQDSLITEVYEGEDRIAYDTGLLPYTGWNFDVSTNNMSFITYINPIFISCIWML